MFLSASTPKLRPFIQNENVDKAGFKKPATLKSSGSQLRTPFRDRSVNSVSPSSKFNANIQMKKKQIESTIKKSEIIKPEVEKPDDTFLDFASYKKIEDDLNDIFPSKRIDVFALFNAYVSRPSPKYEPDEDDEIDFFEVPRKEPDFRCSMESPSGIDDVPLPIFNY